MAAKFRGFIVSTGIALLSWTIGNARAEASSCGNLVCEFGETEELFALAGLVACPLDCNPAELPVGRYRHEMFDFGVTTTPSASIELFQPAGDLEKSRPLVVWVHEGAPGPDTRTPPGHVLLAQSLARRGYAVALLAPQGDVESALRWLLGTASYRIDPDRVALGGSSEGAVTALQLAYGDEIDSRDAASPIQSIRAVIRLGGRGVEPGLIGPDEPPLVSFQGKYDAPFASEAALQVEAESQMAGVPHELHVLEGGNDLLTTHGGEVSSRIADFLYRYVVEGDRSGREVRQDQISRSKSDNRVEKAPLAALKVVDPPVVPRERSVALGCSGESDHANDYAFTGFAIPQENDIYIHNPYSRPLVARYRVDPVAPGTAVLGEDFDFVGEQRTQPFVGAAFFQINARPQIQPRPSRHDLFEILARDAAYRSWREGESVEERMDSIYFLNGLGYRVQKVFNGHFDFHAIGLTSVEYFNLLIEWYEADGVTPVQVVPDVKPIYIYDLDRPPILAFRGTEPSKFLDVVTDFDARGVGFSQFEPNRAMVGEWLDCVSNPFKHIESLKNKRLKPHMTGHSLGGALTQWFAADWASSTRRLGQIATFNSPGVASDTYGIYGASHFARQNVDSVTHYITSGDVASLAGEAFLSAPDGNLGYPNWVLSFYKSALRNQGLLKMVLEKHSIPVVTPILIKDGQQLVSPIGTGFGKTKKFADTDFLNSRFFTYLPDGDYFALLRGVAGLESLRGKKIGAAVAAAMVFRGPTEDVRRTLGKTLGEAITLAVDVKEAGDAAWEWGARAWESIIRMSRSIVDSNGSLQKGASADVPKNFWEAAGLWPAEAWQASVSWPDEPGDPWSPWDIMGTWGPGQWGATVAPNFPWSQTPSWSAADWNNMNPVPVRKLQGRVYHDLDGNGKNDSEPGLPGFVVYLDLGGNGDIAAVTDSSGEFTLFTTLPAGVHRLREQYDATRWKLTAPAAGEHTVTFSSNPSQEISGLDFGNQCIKDCADVPSGTRIWFSKDAFLHKFTDLKNKDVSKERMDPIDTGISTKNYACAVVGYNSRYGDIEEERGGRDIILAQLLPKDRNHPDETVWQLSLDFKTGHVVRYYVPPFPSHYWDAVETWDVDILCLSTRVASIDGPQNGKPYFLKLFPNISRQTRYHNTHIKTNEFVCGIAGFDSSFGDIDEKGKEDIIEAYLLPSGGEWHIRANFAEDYHPGLWHVNVLCASTKIASTDGPQIGKPVFFKTLPPLADSPHDVGTGINSNDFACGVVGFAALQGDIDEGPSTGPLFQAYLFEQGGTWVFHHDFRTHGEHERWENVTLMCIARDGRTPSPPVLWSRAFGGVNSDMAESAGFDAAGNVLATGFFNGGVDFGNGALRNAGGADMFLAKYTERHGKHVWSKSFGGASDDLAFRMTVDRDGSSAVAGWFQGTADFGRGPLTGAGNWDGFLARYGVNGEPLWSTRFGGPEADGPNAMVHDSSGNLVLTGTFRASADFASGQSLTSAGGEDMFLAKYAGATGALTRIRRFGAAGNDRGNGVALDAHGNLFGAATFSGSIDFGGGGVAGAGALDVAAFKESSGNSPLWAAAWGGTGNDQASATAIDAAGDQIVLGSFTETASFGSGTLTSAGGPDIFIAKISTTGTPLWSTRIGGAGRDWPSTLALDSKGNVVVTGSFEDKVDFGDGTRTSAGGTDVFLAAYAADDGRLLWAKVFGSGGNDAGIGVAVSSRDDIAVAGYFEGSIDLGGKAYVSAGNKDAFLMKLGTPRNTGPFITGLDPRTVAPLDGLTVEIVATDSEGDPLTLSADWVPANSNFYPVSGEGEVRGTFTFYPDQTQVGVHLIPFTAKDGFGAITSGELMVTVCTGTPCGFFDPVP